VRAVQLLLDENLSPAIAVRLWHDGFDVIHVRDRGLNAASDAQVLECAYAEDRVLVTLNVADFEKLARSRDLHAGIALIEDAGLLRDEQDALVRRILAAIEQEYVAGRDMVNRVLRISRANAPMFEDMP
jgi:predicted nuclease of predicted toxin-antitoxin system